MRSVPRLILWTGPKHSGKTTALTKLIDRARLKGIDVAGILAPSVYVCDKLLGFDILDVKTNRRCVLARLDIQGSQRIGKFVLSDEGIELGRSALQSACSSASSLIVVDEYGPLELAYGGWRTQVDELIDEYPATILLVVRDELADRVTQLYSHNVVQIIPCHQPDAIDQVIN